MWKKTLDSNTGRSPIGSPQGSKGPRRTSLHLPRIFLNRCGGLTPCLMETTFLSKVLWYSIRCLGCHLPTCCHLLSWPHSILSPSTTQRTQWSRPSLLFSRVILGTPFHLHAPSLLLSLTPHHSHSSFPCSLLPQLLPLRAPLRQLPGSS